MKPDRNAWVVIIWPNGTIMSRPGLFVFPTPDGFAWVEPAYLEPSPSRSAFHRAYGTIKMTSDGFIVENEDGTTYSVEPLPAPEQGVASDCVAACAWGQAQIKEAGKTMDQERDALRKLLREDLA